MKIKRRQFYGISLNPSRNFKTESDRKLAPHWSNPRPTYIYINYENKDIYKIIYLEIEKHKM